MGAAVAIEEDQGTVVPEGDRDTAIAAEDLGIPAAEEDQGTAVAAEDQGAAAAEILLLTIAKTCGENRRLWQSAEELGIPWQQKTWCALSELQASITMQ